MQEFILKNLITIVFLLLCVYNFIKGFEVGFIKKVISVGSIIISIVTTKIFTPIVAGFVKDITNIEATLSDIIYKTFIETKVYDKLNLNSISKIFNTGNLGNTIKNNLCNGIANVLINFLCGVIVFIASIILIRILLKILDAVNLIPFVGNLNRLLGGLLGILEIIIIVWLSFIVLEVFSTFPQVNIIIQNIKKSFIVGTLYNNNLLLNFFLNLFTNINKK